MPPDLEIFIRLLQQKNLDDEIEIRKRSESIQQRQLFITALTSQQETINGQAKTIDELKETIKKLEGMQDPKIIVQGDYVEQKTVQNEIGNVEAGGIGVQTNHYSNGTGLVIPKKGDYNGVKQYIETRMRIDPFFKSYYQTNSRIDLCQLLTEEFKWDVSEHSLTVSLGRNPIK